MSWTQANVSIGAGGLITDDAAFDAWVRSVEAPAAAADSALDALLDGATEALIAGLELVLATARAQVEAELASRSAANDAGPQPEPALAVGDTVRDALGMRGRVVAPGPTAAHVEVRLLDRHGRQQRSARPLVLRRDSLRLARAA